MNKLAAALLSAIFSFVSRLPLSTAFTVGELFGRFACQVAWIIGRNRIGMINLRLAFGREKSKGQFRKILKEMWINFGRSAVEFARFPRYSRENISRFVSWENFDRLVRPRERGRGVIAMTAHFGNWDLLALSTGLNGLPVNLITKHMRSKFVTDTWMKQRARGGVNPIFKKEARREIISILKKNGLVGFVLDQDTKPKEGGIFVDFFGRKASTLSAPALLSEKRDTPVVPLFLVRESRFKHRAFVEEPIEFEKVGDNHEHNVVHNTRRYLEVLERYIRKYPEQWLWIHRRWRRRPPGEPPVYTGAAGKRRRRHPDGVPHNS